MTALAEVDAKTKLGFGTAFLPASPDQAQALLAVAYESGVRHFDTAPQYGWGRAEEALGVFAKGKREELAIVTKTGIEPPALRARLLAKLTGGAARPQLHRFAPSQVRRSIENSLRRLQTDWVDALLLHEVDPDDVTDELMAELDSLEQRGVVAAVGLATSPESALTLLRRYPGRFKVVQVPLAGLEQVETAAVGAQLVVHSALGERLARAQARLASEPRLAQQLKAICGAASADTLAQTLLRAAMARNASGLTLFSSLQPERVRQNMELKPLRPPEMSALGALFDH